MRRICTSRWGYTGELAEGETASVDISHALGDTVAADYMFDFDAILEEYNDVYTNITVSGNRITFLGGAEHAKSIQLSVPVLNDYIAENDETFQVSLSNASSTGEPALIVAATVVTTIVDDDAIAFSITATDTVTEDPSDSDNNLVEYTISYTGTLEPGATASVDVMHLLQDTDSSDYLTANAVVSALTSAAAADPQISFDGTTLTFTQSTATSPSSVSDYPATAQGSAYGVVNWDNPGNATGNTPGTWASLLHEGSVEQPQDLILGGIDGLELPDHAVIDSVRVTLDTTGSGTPGQYSVELDGAVGSIATWSGDSGDWTPDVLVLQEERTSLYTGHLDALRSGDAELRISMSGADIQLRSAQVEVFYTELTSPVADSLSFSVEIADDSVNEFDETLRRAAVQCAVHSEPCEHRHGHGVHHNRGRRQQSAHGRGDDRRYDAHGRPGADGRQHAGRCRWARPDHVHLGKRHEHGVLSERDHRGNRRHLHAG